MKTVHLLLAMTVSTAVFAQDDPVLAHGEKLHEDKCVSCHDTGVYTRADRRVNSMQALSGQVEFCMKGAARADWTPSETRAVVEYLNHKFYKF